MITIRGSSKSTSISEPFQMRLLPTKHKNAMVGAMRKLKDVRASTYNISERITSHLKTIDPKKELSHAVKQDDNYQKNLNGRLFECVVCEALLLNGLSRSSAKILYNWQSRVYGANTDADIAYNTGWSIIVSMLKATQRERCKQAEYDADTLLRNHLGCTDKLYRKFGYADYVNSGVPLEIWLISGKEYPSYTPRRAIEHTARMAGQLRYIEKERCISVYSEKDMERYLLSHKGR